MCGGAFLLPLTWFSLIHYSWILHEQVLLGDSAILPVRNCDHCDIPDKLLVTAVQLPAAILIGWASTLLSGAADIAAIAHWTCCSISLVVLSLKSTTNTSGLCISLKDIQFLLFHALKLSLSNRLRLAFSSGVYATTTIWVWLDDCSCAIVYSIKAPTFVWNNDNIRKATMAYKKIYLYIISN